VRFEHARSQHQRQLFWPSLAPRSACLASTDRAGRRAFSPRIGERALNRVALSACSIRHADHSRLKNYPSDIEIESRTISPDPSSLVCPMTQNLLGARPAVRAFCRRGACVGGGARPLRLCAGQDPIHSLADRAESRCLQWSRVAYTSVGRLIGESADLLRWSRT